MLAVRVLTLVILLVGSNNRPSLVDGSLLGSVSKLVSSKLDSSELVSVAVLFRHGDRTPTTSFPNDPYFNISYWPMGRGQLTKKGENRQFKLGKWFRNRYSRFLPAEYSVKDIYVRSSDVDRTLMSATANLAGLYPPTRSQIRSSCVPWQLIPVHTISLADDQVLYMKSDCPKYTKLYKQESNSEFFRNINEQYADFYETVSGYTGWNVTDVKFIAGLKSVFLVYENYNTSYLPDWASSLDQDKLNYLAELYYARFTFTRELTRLQAGPFFDYLLTHFDTVVKNPEDAPKFLMLSSHLRILEAVLNSVGSSDYSAPGFASSIIWELRKTANGKYFIKMFYKNSNTDADALEIKSCGLSCAYDKYKGILKPITVDMDTWKQECTVDS